MSIAIIDYGSGNLRSVKKAVEFVAEGQHDVHVTSDAEMVRNASHIILPGVGAYKDCMQGLLALPAVIDVLVKRVLDSNVPFLGVCVGMQLLSDIGYEHGEQEGLGWIPGQVVPLQPSDSNLKVPHMGWNVLRIKRSHPVLDGIESGDHAYFVHSYYFDCKDEQNVLVDVDYGGFFPAVLVKDNIIATQFHPEKSQKTGLQLLKNFLNMG